VLGCLQTAAPAAGQPADLQARALAGVTRAASGRAVATQTGSGWSIQFTVAHLADLGRGRFYECWWVGPGNRPGQRRPG
jgi:hypothetical protein